MHALSIKQLFEPFALFQVTRLANKETHQPKQKHKHTPGGISLDVLLRICFCSNFVFDFENVFYVAGILYICDERRDTFSEKLSKPF